MKRTKPKNKRIKYGEAKPGPSEVTGREAIRMVASAHPNWAANPAKKLFPFFMKAEVGESAGSTDSSNRDQALTVLPHNRNLYRGKNSIISKDKVIPTRNISDADINEMWNIMKESSRLILGAFECDRIEARKCLHFSPCSEFNSEYAHIAKRRRWTIFCANHLEIRGDDDKKKYYSILFKKADIKQLISNELFLRNKSYRKLQDIEKRRIKYFINGPMLEIVENSQSEQGDGAVPQFNTEHRLEIARAAMAIPALDESQKDAEELKKYITQVRRMEVSDKALKTHLGTVFPPEYKANKGVKSKPCKKITNRIIELIKAKEFPNGASES